MALEHCEQETAHGQAWLEAVALALAHDALVEHPDSAVRIWTATGLAEALRLTAPDPPFSNDVMAVRGLVMW